MLLKRIFTLILVSASYLTMAQQSQVVFDYIKEYKELAMEEMKRTGVPASIKLAQGIHETQAGTSVLVLKSNNHFGIKCKSVWTGDKVYHDDDETGECFRSYPSPVDSYRDHSNFLKSGQRYSFLFEMDPADYKGWAFGLKKAGYATNIKYSQIIIKLIEDYNLQEYSLIAMGRIKNDAAIAVAEKPKSILADAAAIKEEVATRRANYPNGQFTINNTRVIFAEAGTALLTIAQKYDVSLSRLLEFNDIKSDILGKDQLVYLQRKRKVGASDFHIVQAGETLYDVCQVEGVRLESLVEYNHLKAYEEPAVGEKLHLRSTAQSRPRLNDNAGK